MAIIVILIQNTPDGIQEPNTQVAECPVGRALSASTVQECAGAKSPAEGPRKSRTGCASVWTAQTPAGQHRFQRLG